MEKQKYSFYPLFKLYSDFNKTIEIDKGVSVVPNDIDINLIEESTISLVDKHHFKETSYCLRIDEDIVAPNEASLVFMLSCRLFKCTKVFIRYRLNSSKHKLCIYDLYPYIPSKETSIEITYEEFKKISTLYKNFNQFKDLSIRSGNICYFISLAYRADSWLESLIFFVCALETITSSDIQERGITNKFINRIYNFTGYDRSKLRSIYDVRSELVHGRYSSESKEKNLELMIIAEEVLRKTFVKILSNTEYLTDFKDSSKRLNIFNKS